MLVGGVDDDGFAGALAAHHEHVVLERARRRSCRSGRRWSRSGQAAARRSRVRARAWMRHRFGRDSVRPHRSCRHPADQERTHRWLISPSPRSRTSSATPCAGSSRRSRRRPRCAASWRPTRATTLRCGARWRTSSGLQSLHIPEEYGGQGFTWVELGIVLEEMGAALLCAPYFSTVVLAAERDHERRDRRAAGRAASRHRVGRDHRRRSRSPSPTASGTRRASRWSRPARATPSRSTARRAT